MPGRVGLERHQGNTTQSIENFVCCRGHHSFIHSSIYLFIYSHEKVEVLMRTASVLQQARLCGSTRLTFDDEELTLSRESTEAADGTAAAAAPSAASAVDSASSSTGSVLRRNRRVTFIGNEGFSPTYESVPEERKSLDHPLGAGAQAVDEADSRSLFYRCVTVI